jgi:hypothetical protein
MPLLLLDEGSILFLKEDSFRIGIEEDGKDSPALPTKDSTLTRTALLNAIAQEKAKEKAEKQHRKTPSAATKKEEKPAPKKEPLYRIKLVVESTCGYLKYPYSAFAKVIDDEKLILKSMADGNAISYLFIFFILNSFLFLFRRN